LLGGLIACKRHRPMPSAYIPQDSDTLRQYADLAGRLEASGFDRMWIGELNGADAVSAATLAAVGTREAQIGVFVNVFTRAPTVLAMTAASLAQIAPGRAQLVLGVGSPLFVERWNGIPFDRTFERLRDTLRFLREALTGERVRGPFASIVSDGFSLEDRPPSPPELLVAATGPRALALAASEADGVALNWVLPGDLDRIDPLPRDRRAVAIVVSVCPTDDWELVDATMRSTMANYFRIPAYAEQQRRLGRTDVLEPMWKAWDAGDAVAARAALPDALIDEFVVWGEASACRERLDEIERETGARVVATFFPPDGTTFEAAALP
jgi:probable F420-dependent oxidoreductase